MTAYEFQWLKETVYQIIKEKSAENLGIESDCLYDKALDQFRIRFREPIENEFFNSMLDILTWFELKNVIEVKEFVTNNGVTSVFWL